LLLFLFVSIRFYLIYYFSFLFVISFL